MDTNMNKFDESLYTIEQVKQLFHCLDNNDENLLKKFCDFLNNSSDDVFTIHDSVTKTVSNSTTTNFSSKHLRSKTFLNGECEPNETFESDVEFNRIISSLSNNIRNIQMEFNENKNSTNCEVINSFFSKSNLIQCDLVKIKKFLVLKAASSSERKKSRKDSTSCQSTYNGYINQIMSNRFLFLQLVHFECIIFHYLKCIQQTFPTRSTLSQDVLLSQLQCLFRSYYALIIKLSYESQFVQLVRILHQQSSTITSGILCQYFELIDNKLNHENSGNNKQQQEILDSIINNRSIVIILDYVIILNRLELSCFKENIFNNIIPEFVVNDKNRFDFDENCHIIREYLKQHNHEHLSSQINLVRFGKLVLEKFCSINRFMEKSTLRSRIIIMLFNVCRKLRYDSDRFTTALILSPTLIELLGHCNLYHMEICEQKSLLNLRKEDIIQLEIGEKLIEKDSQLKFYVSVLRDIYGIVSLLLTFTESLITNEYFRSLKMAEVLFQKFMHPFVCSLNGTENDDPNINDDYRYNMNIETISEAYKISNFYRKQFDRVIHYGNRLVVMSSMFIQRLLPSIILPIEDIRNPFRFQYAPNSQTIVKQISEDQEYEVEEDLLIFPGGSDEECLESELFSESELEDTSTSENKKSKEIDSSLAKSYLCFFPETKFHLNDRSNDELKLSCSCDQDRSETEMQQSKNNNEACLSKNSVNQHNKIEDFNWKDTFTAIYDSIKTVIPKEVFPAPELNFHQNNSLVHPMTYPFLRKAIRLKNYHHIKLLDHVGQRLFPDENSKYEIVYDIEKPNDMIDRNHLKFESRFECGNLRKAFIHSSKNNDNEKEYILILNSDVNCTSHTQWFYFYVGQMQKNQKYRFKIINCEKKSILFNSGQQPLFYSCREFEKSGKSWQRIHDDEPMKNNRYMVAYYRNHYVKNKEFKNLLKGKLYYTLEFTFEFPYENDDCYFAFNVPFSFSQLKTCISYWSYMADNHNRRQSENSGYQIFFASQTLCSTLKGNDLPVITITSNAEFNMKHYIMITARVHPSESNSSWILKGFIDFLLQSSDDQSIDVARKNLLDKYIFKIIPMLNPDGVINGCTRTDLQTEDLNRHWGDPSPILHPTIYHSKMLLQCLHTYSGGRNPVAFLDMHGHSRRNNIFSYSCFPMLSWKKSDQQNYYKKHLQNHMCVCMNSTTCKLNNQLESVKNNMDDRVHLAVPPYLTIPLILKYQQSPAFDLDYCSFAMQRDREQTARLVACRQYGIVLTYTIECSASGCDKGPYAGQNLSIIEMEEMGQFLAKSFNFIQFVYCSQQHFPLIQLPDCQKSIYQQNVNKGKISVSNTILNRCARSRTPDKSTTPKQQKIKQMITNLYPDLIEMDSHFVNE
ncbi:Cytosolic carboxypeptidase 1 [Dermatophagoides farinae]|uniref:Cytosolic carboxypeptidase 1 n=1 Tax=Dermatophagoides farinae TaxID=6954 RepID=A0A922L9P2_DERFA|nr:Cytosolic carboxypeptidase 1 [Dermatophagoides farinae]